MTFVGQRLVDKTVLLTGGARGMGAVHARVLAGEGARVLVTDLLDEQGEALAAELRGEGLDVTYRHQDVTDAAGWAHTVAFARDELGGLHVLVNNAGIQSFEDAPNETLEMYEKTIAVNQTSCFLGMKHAIPVMREHGGGSIVNIASTAGVAGDEKQVAYVASKGAIMAMTKAVALDHALESIRVNAVCPGLIASDMSYVYSQAEQDGWLQHTPMRRYGRPEEVSQVVVFLAADESSFVTGISLVVDGGLTIGQQLPLSTQTERASVSA
jgi:NAD(P)-dependent dehydrogenase (short-subunit alcohol dehydrogenase family)